jgi:SAM-dependent methyltransferase
VLQGPALLERLRALPFTERDAWVDALLGIEELPADAPGLPRESVPYLPAGVEEILAAVLEAPITARDDFVDLGSGLGRVVMLVHLLTGARARGIELQEALVHSARERSANLEGVSFLHADATTVALDGSVFFLYAPFSGQMLSRALARLEEVAKRRPIIICAVGLELHDAAWLRPRKTSSLSLMLYDGG